MNEVPSYRFARIYHLVGFIVLCVVSVPMHFFYEWLGKNTFVGYFAPINESIWEHLKLAFWPTVLWWVIGYFVFRERKNLQAGPWFYASLFSLVAAPLIIVSYYYTFTAGLDIVSPTLNIVSLFVGFLVGQLLALHVYRYTTRPNKFIFGVLLLLVVGFGVMLTFLTYNPPELPIFIVPEEG